MTAEMPFADELSEHKLFQQRGMPHAERQGRFELRLRLSKSC